MDIEVLLLHISQSIDKLIDILGQSNVSAVCHSQYNLSEYIDIWLNEYKKPFVKAHTLQSYKIIIEKYIKPNLGDKNLSLYTSLDLQKCLNALPNTRQKEATSMILIDIFGKAYKNSLINKNIIANVQCYKHIREPGFAMSTEQEKIFKNCIKSSKLEKYYLFVLYSGCRRSEALDLTWQDIDYHHKTIHIPGTKTKLSDRYIPLFPNLEKLLGLPNNRKGKIFNYNPDYVSKQLLKIEIPFHVSIKDLRTTFATRCMEKGVPDKVISKWLGHSGTKITNKHYIKVLSDYELEQSKLLE